MIPILFLMLRRSDNADISEAAVVGIVMALVTVFMIGMAVILL